MSAKRTIIETHELKKVFGMGDVSVAALNGVSIRIQAGEFVAITGPSGSGKSTLMHILGCLSRGSGGTYVLDGQDVSHLNTVELADVRNKKIGFIFQAYNLLPRTTALRNVTPQQRVVTTGAWSGQQGPPHAGVGLGDRLRTSLMNSQVAAARGNRSSLINDR
jgi:putative ABC transport system ATP-binding protein